jgi:hypothetical protein
MGGNPHEDAASGSARPYRSFGAFYPFYLSQHADRNWRRLHFLGTTVGLAGVITAVMTWNLAWLVAALGAGYGLAWVGHFYFEKNRPATFTYPLYSFRGDWVMWRDMLTGRIKF